MLHDIVSIVVLSRVDVKFIYTCKFALNRNDAPVVQTLHSAIYPPDEAQSSR